MILRRIEISTWVGCPTVDVDVGWKLFTAGQSAEKSYIVNINEIDKSHFQKFADKFVFWGQSDPQNEVVELK